MTDTNNITDEAKDMAAKKEADKKEWKKTIEALLDTTNKSRAKVVFDYIQLGKALVDARVLVDLSGVKEIVGDTLSDKSINRYTKLVLTKETKLTSVLDKDLNKYFDKRIIELTVEQLEKVDGISLTRLTLIKQLGDPDFKDVLGGNNKNSAYADLLKPTSSSAKATIDYDELFKALKTTLIKDKDEYKEYYKDPEKTIKELVKNMNLANDLEFKLETANRELQILQKEYSTLKDQFNRYSSDSIDMSKLPPNETNSNYYQKGNGSDSLSAETFNSTAS